MRAFPILIALVCCAAAAPAQDALDVVDYVLDGGDLRDAFAGRAKKVRPSVVGVVTGLDDQILGVVVRDDGLILTKASDLGESPAVTLADGRELCAETVARDEKHDLALIKVEAEGLTPVSWFDKRFAVGQWVITVGQDERPLGVGVVSVAPRKISSSSGYLGVMLGEAKDGGIPVDQVLPDTAASKAGLIAGDLIIRMGGKAVKDRDTFIEAIGGHEPGETMKLEVERDGKSVKIEATLGKREEASGNDRRRRRGTNGRTSLRTNGFPQAFTHDTVLRPEAVGGPVIDVHGRVVAVNIARAGRTMTHAVPASTVRRVIVAMLEATPASTQERAK